MFIKKKRKEIYRIIARSNKSHMEPLLGHMLRDKLSFVSM